MVQNIQLNFHKNIWECFERNWCYVTCAKNSCALHQSEAMAKNHGSLCEKSPWLGANVNEFTLVPSVCRKCGSVYGGICVCVTGNESTPAPCQAKWRIRFVAFKCVRIGFVAFKCVPIGFVAFKCVRIGFGAWLGAGVDSFSSRTHITPYTLSHFLQTLGVARSFFLLMPLTMSFFQTNDKRGPFQSSHLSLTVSSWGYNPARLGAHPRNLRSIMSTLGAVMGKSLENHVIYVTCKLHVNYT